MNSTNKLPKIIYDFLSATKEKLEAVVKKKRFHVPKLNQSALNTTEEFVINSDDEDTVETGKTRLATKVNIYFKTRVPTNWIFEFYIIKEFF